MAARPLRRLLVLLHMGRAASTDWTGNLLQDAYSASTWRSPNGGTPSDSCVFPNDGACQNVDTSGRNNMCELVTEVSLVACAECPTEAELDSVPSPEIRINVAIEWSAPTVRPFDVRPCGSMGDGSSFDNAQYSFQVHNRLGDVYETYNNPGTFQVSGYSQNFRQLQGGPVDDTYTFGSNREYVDARQRRAAGGARSILITLRGWGAESGAPLPCKPRIRSAPPNHPLPRV